MRTPLALVIASSLAGLAKAHYTFPSLIINGAVTPAWQYVRQTGTHVPRFPSASRSDAPAFVFFQDNHYSNAPVTDVTTSQIRCYESSTASTTSTVTVAAGSTIGFSASQAVYHPGVCNISVLLLRLSWLLTLPVARGSTWMSTWPPRTRLTLRRRGLRGSRSSRRSPSSSARAQAGASPLRTSRTSTL